MERMKAINLKKILLCLLIASILFSVFLFYGCTKKVEDYTVEQHIQRIKSLLEKKYLDGLWIDSETSAKVYELYPLYDESEKLTAFLVECEPNGFTFISLVDEDIVSYIIGYRMYQDSGQRYGNNRTWSPYTIDETKSQPEPDRDKIFEYDEFGNKICYNRSPYLISQKMNDRKYFIRTNGGNYICAIKNEDKFINLMNSKPFDINQKEKQATLYVGFIQKPQFSLK